MVLAQVATALACSGQHSVHCTIQRGGNVYGDDFAMPTLQNAMMKASEKLIRSR
jgi:hypothetical protein